MKAAVRYKYGPPEEVLSIKEFDKPTLNDNEVLIRVHASSANRTTSAGVEKPFRRR